MDGWRMAEPYTDTTPMRDIERLREWIRYRDGNGPNVATPVRLPSIFDPAIDYTGTYLNELLALKEALAGYTAPVPRHLSLPQPRHVASS